MNSVRLITLLGKLTLIANVSSRALINLLCVDTDNPSASTHDANGYINTKKIIILLF